MRLRISLILLLAAPLRVVSSTLNNRLFGPSSEQKVVLSDGPTHVAGFASLGDSYSAGIGTPSDGPENDCRQGIGAYPYLLAADLLPLAPTITNTSNPPSIPPTHPNFQWLSCTGSTTLDMLSQSPSSQIDALNASLPVTFATLSIGGNDLGFFDVMNACVFRFYAFYSGTCEAALAASDAHMESPMFGFRLRLVLAELLDRIRWERRPDFRVSVTGYARFFDASTAACDDVSLGVWWGGGGEEVKLTRATRRRMNDLVLRVNDRLRLEVDEINRRFVTPKAVFVDYDAAFDGHRFCEEGVAEPDYARNETWFFFPGGPDNGRAATNGPGGGETTLSADSPFVDPNTCLSVADSSGDWGLRALCYMAVARQGDPSLRPREGAVSENAMWYVPTYYGKTFHPRSLGHEAIRDRIYEVWRENGIDLAPRR